MFAPNLVIIALVVLAALSSGGIAYALLFDRVSGAGVAAKRLERILDTSDGKQAEAAPTPAARSKRSLQSALKEFEDRQKAKNEHNTKPTLSMRLTQAGLSWSRRTYILFSIALAAGTGFGLFVLTGKVLVAVGGVVIGGLGLPSWIVNHLRKRRQKAFIGELPTAIDLIVRGIRSGLPLGDCLRMIATETKEPVKSEFRVIMEAQQMGLPVGDACLKLYERMPLQEANFFGIVIAIQQKAGGNLSEALGNLGNVLRERRKMREKIQAMSMEAKASAAIIGSLPFVVTGLVYLTSPNYIKILFNTTSGHFILVGGLLYMSIGVLVMRHMINFDF
ncbi:MAG: type II secretion system F family protein [Phyllobacteriaceae bacterium]|nr:type II secretion system F family protein [Phyllobacteriaceae bacterium]